MDVESTRRLEAKLKKLSARHSSRPTAAGACFPAARAISRPRSRLTSRSKLTGMRAGDEPMMQARRWILSHGGIANCGHARALLSRGDEPGAVGCDDRAAGRDRRSSRTGSRSTFTSLSSWARGTLFGLMLLQAARPMSKIDWQRRRAGALHRAAAFHQVQTAASGETVCRCATLLQSRRPAAALLRPPSSEVACARDAMRHAESWLLEHQDANGSWGGIQPCYLLSAMALKGLGYRNDHPVIKKALEATRELIWDQGDYDPLPAVRVAQLGHRARRPRRCSIRASRPSIRRCATRRSGSSIIRSSSAAIGRSSGPTSNPADGPSSFTTTGIPTSTIPRSS